MTFLEISQEILDFAKRPDTSLPQAKREVNNAILWAQRRHNFEMSKRLVKVLYPANSLFADIEAVCEAKVRSLISVQKLRTCSSNEGEPIEVVSYETLQGRRTKFSDVRSFYPDGPPVSHGEFASRNYGLTAFLTGQGFGLYPTPNLDVDLLLYLSIWLPRLTEDDDTNFLLEYGSDVILYRALTTFSLFLKADDRIEISATVLGDAWSALMQWDSDITALSGI